MVLICRVGGFEWGLGFKVLALVPFWGLLAPAVAPLGGMNGGVQTAPGDTLGVGSDTTTGQNCEERGIFKYYNNVIIQWPFECRLQ